MFSVLVRIICKVGSNEHYVIKEEQEDLALVWSPQSNKKKKILKMKEEAPT